MREISSDGELAARIEKLETHVAHQEAVIADLNEAVTDQWAQIERLKRLVGNLSDRLGETESKIDEALPQKPPPHY